VAALHASSASQQCFGVGLVVAFILFLKAAGLPAQEVPYQFVRQTENIYYISLSVARVIHVPLQAYWQNSPRRWPLAVNTRGLLPTRLRAAYPLVRNKAAVIAHQAGPGDEVVRGKSPWLSGRRKFQGKTPWICSAAEVCVFFLCTNRKSRQAQKLSASCNGKNNDDKEGQQQPVVKWQGLWSSGLPNPFPFTCVAYPASHARMYPGHHKNPQQ